MMEVSYERRKVEARKGKRQDVCEKGAGFNLCFSLSSFC